MKRDILGIDPNERLILDIKRHPIGVIGYSAFGIFTILLLLGVLLVIININEFSAAILGFITIGALIVGLLILAFTAVAVHVYRSNELIVTNENIIQILKQSLIDRKTSQLNLSKVQDVSVDQEGWAPTIFGYGTVTIETAGEAGNYVFSHVHNPAIVAKKIVEAHEAYVDTIAVTSAGRDGI